MPKFHSEEITISITFTTDGEVINRITGARTGGNMKTNEVLIAYLEQFGGIKVQQVDKQQLRADIDKVIDKHLSYDREANHGR